MALYTLAPVPYQKVTDTNDDPVALGLVYTFLTGTSTPSPTYTDAAGQAANANPIVAGSDGSFVAYLPAGVSQKWVFKNAAGTVTYKTVDPVSAVPASSQNQDITGTLGEDVDAGDVVYLSDGSGSKTAGSWFKADADNTYSSTTAIVGMVPDAGSSGATATIRLGGEITGLSGLVVGTTYYISATAGDLTATAPGNARPMGVAVGTGTIIIAPNPAPSTTISSVDAILTMRSFLNVG